MIPSDKTILMQSGLGKWLNLLFFVLMLAACAHEATEIKIIYIDQQPKGILIPEKDLKGIATDSIHIRSISDISATNILGHFSNKNGIVFEPLVPFTRGLTYGVFAGNQLVSQITIPLASAEDAPKVVAIYPLQDTLPENLLKMYFCFSHPMKEGMSANNILLIRNNKDTLQDVFLDLQPELWNEERTVLTLWLDPGRIKRDLQPNLKLGNPLQKNQHYELIVSQNWQNTSGSHMQKDLRKNFVVYSRDSLSPVIEEWKTTIPQSGSKSPLMIDLTEPLDHFLLMECISVVDKNNLAIKGKIEIMGNDKQFVFTPTKEWTKGNYAIRILSKLEDLAGNNLNKVFDRDILHSKKPGTREYYEKRFTIQ